MAREKIATFALERMYLARNVSPQGVENPIVDSQNPKMEIEFALEDHRVPIGEILTKGKISFVLIVY